MEKNLLVEYGKFTQYYPIENYNNAYIEQFKNAVLLSLSGNKKLAQKLFKKCFLNTTDLGLWNGYIELQWDWIDNTDKNDFVDYMITIADDKLETHPFILKTLVDFLNGHSHYYDRFINLLNYKVVSNGSDKVIAVFSSRNDDPKKINFQFTNLLKDYNVDIIFFRDIQDAWYNKGLYGLTNGIDSSVKFIKNMLDSYNKVMMMGSSSGGYASILFGSLLQADAVLAFSPQTLIPRSAPLHDAELLKNVNKKYFDLVPYINDKVDISVFFSIDYKNDHEAAIRLKDYGNVRLFPLEAGVVHAIIPYLIKNDIFFPLIDKMIA